MHWGSARPTLGQRIASGTCGERKRQNDVVARFMQKRLVRVGESLALIIDKPILSVMQMTRLTRLDVTYDGNRIIIEPLIGNGDPRLPTAREALKVYRELEQLGLTRAYFDLLTPVPMRLGRYVTAMITCVRRRRTSWRSRCGEWPSCAGDCASGGRSARRSQPRSRPCRSRSRAEPRRGSTGRTAVRDLTVVRCGAMRAGLLERHAVEIVHRRLAEPSLSRSSRIFDMSPTIEMTMLLRRR